MEPLHVANAVRAACVEAAVRAFEDAGIQGLCAEGRWEAAVAAMRALDLRVVLRELAAPSPASSATSSTGDPS